MSKFRRRDFLKIISRFLTFSGLAAVLGPIVAYFYPPNLEETPTEPVLIGTQDELPMNTSKTVPFGRYPAIVIHSSAGLRAYSAVCTHLACIVQWDESKNLIICPCHDGIFDPIDGHVMHGPPPTPLEAIPIQEIDGQIYIGEKS